MTASLKMKEFMDSPQASEIRNELISMMNDSRYNTRAKYSALAKGDVSFVDKHITYLSLHLGINSSQYLSNLRLITKYN